MRRWLILLMLALVAGCGAPSRGATPAPVATSAPVSATAPVPTPALVATPVPAPEPPAEPAPVSPAVSVAQDGEQVKVRVGQAGGESKVVASVPAPWPQAQTWTHLHKGNLILIVTPNELGPGGRLYRIDLDSGETADLGAMIGPPWRHGLVTSPDGRYLALQVGSMGFSVTLIDFASGARTDVPGEAHLNGAAWSPTESLLAVRAAGAGSNLPVFIASQWVEGGDHIDVIDTSGTVRHLHPPEPLQLTTGPAWAPDGRQIAVTSGVVKAVGTGDGGGSEFAPKLLWTIDVATNTWKQHGPAPEGRQLTWPGTP